MPSEAAIQRHLQRLDRKLAAYQAQDRRYSWLRLGIFLIGAAATWIASGWSAAAPYAAWSALTVASAAFISVVALHRRLDARRTTFVTLRQLYQEKAARMALDWERLPAPLSAEGDALSPLARDLDLLGPRSLHHLIDTSVSTHGSRLLADWLTNGAGHPQQSAHRQALVRQLAGMDAFRNCLALLFRRVSRAPLNDHKLLHWLDAPLPESRLARLLPWAALLAVVNLGLLTLAILARLPSQWLPLLLIYPTFYMVNYAMLDPFMSAMVDLDEELQKFRPLLTYLEHYRYGANLAVKDLCRPFWKQANRPSLRLRQVQLVTALVGLRANVIIKLLLNLALPWDFWVAWLAARQRRRLAEAMPAWLEAFHTLEAAASLGEFAALHPHCTFPELLDPNSPAQAVFSAQGLGHPLLSAAQKVCNDATLRTLGEVWIITGSNMSGKSTFVRTLGVNLCLAYAGGPVNARRLSTRLFRLHTCIRINDSLDQGFSYFYAEVRCLKTLLDALQAHPSGLPLFYLIDEIFRGTNNRERLIGSRAFVKALLGAHGVGVIATHDLELASLAAGDPQAINYHFSDQVQDGKLTFDYRLRPGVSPTTNALTIMALEGLPVDWGEAHAG